MAVKGVENNQAPIQRDLKYCSITAISTTNSCGAVQIAVVGLNDLRIGATPITVIEGMVVIWK